MDFTKFVSLLENKALFFPRADKLSDSFEGSFSRANIPIRTEMYGEDGEVKPEDLSEIYKLLRELTVISCWHISADDAHAVISIRTGVAFDSIHQNTMKF